MWYWCSIQGVWTTTFQRVTGPFLARTRADTQAALHALNSIVGESTSDATPAPSNTIATQSEALLRAGTDLTDLLQAAAAPPAR